MKKLFIVIICFLVLGTLCFLGAKIYQNKEENQLHLDKQTTNQEETSKVNLKDVLENNKKLAIKNEDGTNYHGYLNSFSYYGKTFQIEEYAFVDFDGDGKEEIIALTNHDAGVYLILHEESETIYGYLLGIRLVSNLKEDGTFLGSNGANAREYCQISFHKEQYTIKVLASFDGDNHSYQMEDKTVTKAEIEDYMESFEKKQDVTFCMM